MENIIDILQARGFIEALTHDDIRKLTEKPLKVYVGFDPTADSLHLGNYVAIMGLAWFQKLGHTPVAVVGGATGMIGDPSGKSKERQLLDPATLEKNLKGITKDLEKVLDSNHPTAKPEILNNYDWFKDFTFIDFLREVGKYFRMGPMLAKDSVKTRLNSEEGMSFTEFSYQLLQGYDFAYLNEHHNVSIQMGGSDQWGNITAGTELTRKLNGSEVCGVTFPLLMRSDGKKFGKSEEGAIWLSSEKCSPYQFYQYFISLPDEDVGKLMRLLTFMDLEEIEAIEKEMKSPGYVQNTAQKRLGEEVTRIVHGEEGLQTALRVTEGAKPGSMSTELNAEVLESLAADMPSTTLSIGSIVDNKLIEVIVSAGLLASKGEARRMVRNGGVYLNNQKVGDENLNLNENDLIEGRLFLLGVGKKKKVLVRVSR